MSVTRKLGYTEMGDISDTMEIGSALTKSVENSNYISRANLDLNVSMAAIKQQDDAAEQSDLERRTDLSSGNAFLDLKTEMEPVSASQHLHQALVQMRESKDISHVNFSIRQIDTRKESEISNNNVLDQSVNNSLALLSKRAVQKAPVSTP